jgi:hypothetical protein
LAASDDAAGTVTAATTIAGAMIASASLPRKRHLLARLPIRVTRPDMPGIPGLLTPLLEPVDRKISYLL